MKPTDQNQLPDRYIKTSDLLKDIISGLKGEAVTVNFIVEQLKSRSFGGLFVILGALALLPGISFFSGLALIVPGMQMLATYPVPRLPKIISEREISVSHLQSLGEKAARAIEWLEQFVKPRYLSLSTKPVQSFIGFLVCGLALAVMLPLPFSNFPGAVALLFLSVGLLERDGIMILLGIFCAIIALLISAAISYLAFESFMLFLQK